MKKKVYLWAEDTFECVKVVVDASRRMMVVVVVLHNRWCQRTVLSSLVMVTHFAGGSGSCK